MDAGVEAIGARGDEPRAALLALYEPALPQVYGYFLRRCGTRETAEELTSETFLAAADAVCRTPSPRVDVAWLIGVARHKLADHWRRRAREERALRAVRDEPAARGVDDPWDAELDRVRAEQTLATLGAHHRLVLVLRYLDDLPVARVAELIGRNEHATEALLVRARRAFRAQYEAKPGGRTSREEDGRA